MLAHASSLVREGHYDDAIQEIEAARKRHAADARLLTVEGLAFSLNGDDTRALVALRRALRLDPSFLGALQAEGEILNRRHDPAAAAVLEKIVERQPGNATAHEMLASAYASAGRCPAALEQFRLAGEEPASHPDTLAHEAACLADAKRFPEAARILQTLHALRPDDADVDYDLALMQLQAGKASDAEAILRPLIAKTSDVQILSLAAEIDENLGDTPRAAAHLREAIVASPAQPQAYLQFAELCMAHESYQAGIDMTTAGIAHLPQEASLFLARGLLYGGMAQYDKAEADFRTAERLDPNHGTGAYGAGLIQAQRSDPEAALVTVRSALHAHPEDAQLHFLLARLLVEQGAHPGTPAMEEALTAATTAVRLAPELLGPHDLLAKLDMDLGRTAPAIEQCRAALALDPTDRNAMYRIMRLLRETGDAPGAQAIGKQLADLLQQGRQEETKRLRYRIEDAPAHP